MCTPARRRRPPRCSPSTRRRSRDQVERLRAWREQRDAAGAAAAGAALAAAAVEGRNVMPAILDAVRAGGTLGEIADTLRGVYGEHRDTTLE